MNSVIFREYDIRGLVPDDLNKDTVYRLGLAIGTYYQDKGANNITVGRDCRLSSPELRDGLIKGLTETGISVVDVGMVPTPLLYFSIVHTKADGGIMITGSHNPSNYNGLKICLGTASIYGKEIQSVGEITEKGAFKTGNGSIEDMDIIKPYIQYMKENIHGGDIKRKVVVDAGNGVGGLAAPEVFRNMGVEVEELYCDPDGHFPNHHPDPTIPENLKDLASRVSETSADLGIGFDGDADRIGVIDKDGKIIWGDQLMIIFARDLLETNPGAAVIGEVKCSQVLYDDIEKRGGKPIMWKAGHSLIKGKMKEEKALLAGEMSGHIFIADRYFGFDDAIYAGARLLEIITKKDLSVRDLLAGIPEMVNTPEIRIDCPDDKKTEVVTKITEEFKKEYDVIDVDGARVLFDGGWGLIRQSNTQPVLVLRFEAKDKETLENIRKIFMDKLDKAM